MSSHLLHLSGLSLDMPLIGYFNIELVYSHMVGSRHVGKNQTIHASTQRIQIEGNSIG
jgi:hypothetical protein